MEESHKPHEHTFVPALGFDWLTPLYDPLVRFTMREEQVKQRLVDQARIQPGMTVVDFGCGTGTLAMMTKRSHPAARVIGIDVDPKILDIARGKIAAAGLEIELRCAYVQEAGLAAGSVDRVLTTLMLHHLTREEKLAALRAVHTALRPGGELHVADFGPAHNTLMWLVSTPFRYFDGEERTRDNFDGTLPDVIRQAGFATVAEHGQRMTPFGSLVYWSAVA